MEPQQPNQPAATPAPSATTPAATGTRYGGFWIRFVAAVIDGVIIGIVMSPFRNVTGYNFLSFAVTVVYSVVLLSSSWQATVGKKALGLKVTDVDGNRLTPQKAVIRELSKIVSALILLIGYIMAAFDARKQALHDRIAGTLVVKG